ncbi:ABC transporter permease [Micromonospora sp. NPDC007208]|uniref:ABC transporter permease n=1 Tax=Micromonospora sp. NPDC007208 TaxID=3364236 RepID=UPI00369AE29A
MPTFPSNGRVPFGRSLRIIAGREIRLRTFSRAALMGLAFSVLIIAGLIFVPKLIGGDAERARVAVVGMTPTQLQAASAQLPGHELVQGQPGQVPDKQTPYVVSLGDAGTTGAAWKSSQLTDLEGIVTRLQLDRLAGEDSAVATPQLTAVSDDSEDTARLLIGYLVVVLLFGQIVGMASAVTQALMEEKANRVIDLLLPKVKTLALLWGKVIGAGVAGLVQTGVMAAAALLLLAVSGDHTTMGIVLEIGWVVLLWYALGFLFMGVIYGAVGGLMRKPDDAPTITVPMQLINMMTFLVGIVAVQNPAAAWVDVINKVPPFSAVLVPLGVITREISTADVLASTAVILACALVLSLIGARLFAAAVRMDTPGEALRRFWRRTA